jgi:hypothetical protein
MAVLTILMLLVGRPVTEVDSQEQCGDRAERHTVLRAWYRRTGGGNHAALADDGGAQWEAAAGLVDNCLFDPCVVCSWAVARAGRNDVRIGQATSRSSRIEVCDGT